MKNRQDYIGKEFKIETIDNRIVAVYFSTDLKEVESTFEVKTIVPKDCKDYRFKIISLAINCDKVIAETYCNDKLIGYVSFSISSLMELNGLKVTWIYNKPILEENKCTCEITVLMNRGCQCGVIYKDRLKRI